MLGFHKSPLTASGGIHVGIARRVSSVRSFFPMNRRWPVHSLPERPCPGSFVFVPANALIIDVVLVLRATPAARIAGKPGAVSIAVDVIPMIPCRHGRQDNRSN